MDIEKLHETNTIHIFENVQQFEKKEFVFLKKLKKVQPYWKKFAILKKKYGFKKTMNLKKNSSILKTI